MHDADFLRKQVEESLESLSIPDSPSDLYDPIRYTLDLGGKRIRPVTCLMACELFGTDYMAALPAALSIEIFHNFTLLHDDIMDQAPIRRGKASVYRKWNTNVAILSGDTMFALAYTQLQSLPPVILPTVLGVFSKTAIEVCEGQQFDMDFETKKQVSIDEYLRMIRLKTAVLLAASMEIGAICGGADEIQARHLYEFGENTGLAFQLMDDYLDTFGDEKVFGKKTGNDIVAGKKTYLLLRALEVEKQQGSTALEEALLLNDSEQKVARVTEIMQERGVSSEVKSLIRNYHDKAMTALGKVEANTESLAALAEKLLGRDY